MNGTVMRGRCGTPRGLQTHYRQGETPCELCRTAWNAYHRERNLAQGTVKLSLADYFSQFGNPHGKRSRYNKGCRCQECTAAATTYSREYRANRRTLGGTA